jgi:CRP/FNR family transcriptional regulator
MERAAIVEALARVELFRALEEPALEDVADIAREWPVAAGGAVYFAGDLATEFFVVVEGSVRVAIPGGSDDLTAAIVEPGRLFGEMALLDGGPRAATATAISPTLLLEIRREDWLTLVADDARLAQRVFTALGSSVRRYASDLVDLQFVDLEIPEAPAGSP